MNVLKSIALACLSLMNITLVSAQQVNTGSQHKGLKIGDEFIAPTAIQQLPNRGNTIDLHKLENKVVILDFFDTYCGTCIQSMPHLQQLQNKLKNKIQIITVGWQDKATLEKFYTNNAFLKVNKVNLPVIYSDVYLKEKFPHQSVPHVVFLFKGKVQAITGGKLITEENILSLFKEGTIDLPLKDDFGRVDLMANTADVSLLKGAVSLSGYQNGVPFGSLKMQQDSSSRLKKSSFYNVSIYSAVLTTWAKIKKADYLPRPERLVMNVKDPNRYKDMNNIGDMWYRQYAISYERLDSIQRADSAQAAIVLNDLHNFLGIRTYKAMKPIECLILKPCPIKPYSGKELLNGQVYEGTDVMTVMIDLSGKYPPVLDRVKTKDKITLGSYSNLQELNEQLAAYGIKAEPGVADMEVLVIEETK